MNRTTIAIWSSSLAIALLAGAAHHLDVPNNQDDYAASSALADAQRAARAEQRHAAALVAQCAAERGPNSAVVQQADGGWRCTDKRGRGTTVVAGLQP